MTKAKATHKGTCQCCGRLQKLPDNVLSLHGYSVKYNFFEGICGGAGQLPYEKSCDLIKQFIRQAEIKRVGLIAFQERLRQKAIEPKAWYRLRIAFFGYVWREVALSKKSDPDEMVITQVDSGEVISLKYHADKWRVDKLDVLDYATELNRKRATSLDSELIKIEDYIAWQTKRVNDWVLKETFIIEKENHEGQ